MVPAHPFTPVRVWSIPRPCLGCRQPARYCLDATEAIPCREDCLTLLAVGDVDGLAIHGQRSFLHRLGHGRVGEDHHAQILGTGAEFHGDGALLYQLGGARPDHMHAQNPVALGAGDDLDETGCVVGGHGTPTGGEGKHADIDLDAFSLELLLVLADPGGFGVGVDNRRNQVVVHLRLVTGDALGNHNTLFGGLVGQHQAAHHVTDGVNARHRGGAVVVDIDIATLVQGNTGVGGQQIRGDRTTTNRHDQTVEGHFLVALGVGELDGDFVTLDLGAGNPGTQQYVQALLGVDFHGLLGQLLVGGDQELVEGLDHCDLGAQTRPYGAELQTDHTSTDNAQTLGHSGKFQRTGGIDDDLLVNRS